MEIKEVPEMVGVTEVRESSRKVIAYGITGAFILFILISILFTVFSPDQSAFQNGKELISSVGSVFGGLVGAVVGFYFGSGSE